MKEQHLDIDDDMYLQLAAWGDVAGIDTTPIQKPKTVNETLLSKREGKSPTTVFEDLRSRLSFKQSRFANRIKEDVIGMKRRLPDRVETYWDKLTAGWAKGLDESATDGLVRVGDHEASIFAMHWKFIGGSLSVASAQSFLDAGDTAVKKDIPFISFYSSGGVRQHENGAGLKQMPRLVNAMRHFKEHTRKPQIAVLGAQVWGGVSASSLPHADVTIALLGTDFGFSGPRVIKSYEQQDVPFGTQSAEVQAVIYRNLDVIVEDKDELFDYLKRFLDVTDSKHAKLTEETLPDFHIVGNPQALRSFDFSNEGIANATTTHQVDTDFQAGEEVVFQKEVAPEDKLMQEYEAIIRSAKRPDAAFFMEHGFSEVVPLYNSYSVEDRMNYPAIIASIGKIGPQPFLLIGTQPSYQKSGETVRKIPSSPEPKDFRYMQRMLKMGKRLKLPLVLFTDTLGARPSIKSEEDGQSREIAYAMYDVIDYPEIVQTYDINAIGSGGGEVTNNGDFVGMLSKAHMYVAEPRSAASIIYAANPSVEQVRDTINSLRVTADDQLDLGLIDAVIPESDNTLETVKNVHDAIAQNFIRLQKKSQKRRLSERDKKIRGYKGFELVKTRRLPFIHKSKQPETSSHQTS